MILWFYDSTFLSEEATCVLPPWDQVGPSDHVKVSRLGSRRTKPPGEGQCHLLAFWRHSNSSCECSLYDQIETLSLESTVPRVCPTKEKSSLVGERSQ